MGTRPGVRGWRASAAVTIITALGLVLLSACGGTTGRSAGAQYVALGDSYTSGPGIGSGADTGCGRSKANYASLVAKAEHIEDFVDNSCGGATTENLTHRQAVRGISNVAQLKGVGKSTDLVTIGIGLNDFGLSTALLYTCLPLTGTISATCQVVMDVSDGDMKKQLDRAAANVSRALTKIRKDAPRARVILVGYPRVAPDTGTCPHLLPMPDAMVARLGVAMAYVDKAWRKAAESAGADYVDMYKLSEGHDICSGASWIDDVASTLGDGAPLHPLATYHEAVADQIVRLLKQ